MKRRNFLLTSLLSIPAVSFAKFKNKYRAKKGILIKADESRFNGMVKSGDTSAALCKVSSIDTDGDVLFIAPGEKAFNAVGGPPLHIHLYQDEIFYVVEGEYILKVGDDEFHASAGDTLFAPRQVPHTFARVGDKPGKLLTVFQPAGKMEDFFNKLNNLEGTHSPDVFMKLFEEHDMKIVGPPLKV
ncbi:MAG: cupin domain-containing protein [Ferruginibacter sp.]